MRSSPAEKKYAPIGETYCRYNGVCPPCSIRCRQKTDTVQSGKQRDLTYKLMPKRNYTQGCTKIA